MPSLSFWGKNTHQRWAGLWRGSHSPPLPQFRRPLDGSAPQESLCSLSTQSSDLHVNRPTSLAIKSSTLYLSPHQQAIFKSPLLEIPKIKVSRGRPPQPGFLLAPTALRPGREKTIPRHQSPCLQKRPRGEERSHPHHHIPPRHPGGAGSTWSSSLAFFLPGLAQAASFSRSPRERLLLSSRAPYGLRTDSGQVPSFELDPPGGSGQGPKSLVCARFPPPLCVLTLPQPVTHPGALGVSCRLGLWP